MFPGILFEDFVVEEVARGGGQRIWIRGKEEPSGICWKEEKKNCIGLQRI